MLPPERRLGGVPKLMTAWPKFWRDDGYRGTEGSVYGESSPHLMLMSFLQRVVDGGGHMEHHYGLGRGALGLRLAWKDRHHAIEIKIRRDTETETEALAKVATYLDREGLADGWLVLFDLRLDKTWADKCFLRTAEHQGKTIRIVGC